MDRLLSIIFKASGRLAVKPTARGGVG